MGPFVLDGVHGSDDAWSRRREMAVGRIRKGLNMTRRLNSTSRCRTGRGQAAFFDGQAQKMLPIAFSFVPAVDMAN
jgi:hypothetical protein